MLLGEGWPYVWTAVLVTEGDGREAATASATGAAAPVTVAPVGDPIAFGDLVAASGAPFVVIAIPADLQEQARAAVTMTALRWPRLRIAWMVSDHAPLAMHAALIAARSSVTDAGLVPGFVEAFAGRCWSGAWAPSVAGLSRPGPTAGQYLRSFLPGSHFLISWAPRAQIGRPETVSSFARRDVPRMLLVDEPGLSPTVSAQLAEATGAIAVRPYPLPGSWSGVVRVRGATQLALVPADPTTTRVRAVAGCPHCGVRVAGAVCPYCHVVADPLPPEVIRLAEPFDAGVPVGGLS